MGRVFSKDAMIPDESAPKASLIGQESDTPEPSLELQKNKFYFQYRLDLLKRNKQEEKDANTGNFSYKPEKRHSCNPRMYVGIARDSFHLD